MSAPREVNHRQYGPGIARLSRQRGFEWQVRFTDGTNRWVRTEHLEFLESMPRRFMVAQPSHNPNMPHFQERRIIEALRFGIVPDEGVNLYTVGREKEIEELRVWLQTPNENDRILIGRYGVGKTHLLRYIYQDALKQGFATAFVEMDPLERPFSKPKRVYSQIVQSLEWPSPEGEIFGFRDLIKQATHASLLQDNYYFRHLQNHINEETWEWIEARESAIRPRISVDRQEKLPGLYDYTTTANIYCYLLSTLGWLAQQPQFGLKGLLIIFDEAESISAHGSTVERERRINFVDALIRTAKNDQQLLKPPYESDLTYAGHADRVPFLFKSTSGLKLLFAFTDIWSLPFSSELRNGSREKTFVHSLTAWDMRDLTERVHHLYEHAYDIDISDLIDNMPTQDADTEITRMHVKGLVEELDIARFRQA